MADRRSLLGVLLVATALSCAKPLSAPNLVAPPRAPTARGSSSALRSAASASSRAPLPNAPPAYWADGFSATTTKRALLRYAAPLRYTEQGGVLHVSRPGAPLSRPKEATVVAELPSAVRVLLELRDVRLLLYADVGALAQVPRTATVLTPRPLRPADPSSGVRVMAGFFLHEQERRGSWVRVAGASGSVSFEGWVEAQALGVVYEEQKLEAVVGDGLVRPGTVVSAAPDGPSLAKLGTDSGGPRDLSIVVEREGVGPAGWQRIRLRTKELEVWGLVRASDLHAKPPGAGRLGGSHRSRPSGGALSDSLVGTLAAGASLHAPEDRSVVGRVLNPMRVYYDFGPPDLDGLRAVHFFGEELGLITAMAGASAITVEATP